MPSLPVPSSGPGTAGFFESIGQHMSNSFINNVDPGVTYIDIPLSDLALENLVVRTGPLASAGTKTCVEALVAQFAPRARLESSVLAGAVRVRGR